MSKYQFFRTDLAIEENERVSKSIPGVTVFDHTEKSTGININIVKIKDESGEQALNKPAGTYITLSGGCIDSHTEEDAAKSSIVLGSAIKRLLPKKAESIFVLGLGNSDMTADALGPLTVKKLLINRRITPMSPALSALTPGVLGQTGLEALEIVKGITETTRPDVIIVIDALCAMSEKRLLKTIQLCDTGIVPGSGVGNHRNELSKRTLSVPVISIGVPTVISALSLTDQVSDPDSEKAKRLGSMFVTVKDIDIYIKEMSVLLSEGIHQIIYPDYETKDISS